MALPRPRGYRKMRDSILTEWLPETIITANEHNLYNLCIKIAQLDSRDVYLSQEFCWVSTVPSTWPNFIFGFKIDAQNAQENLQHLKTLVVEAGIPNLLVLRHTDDQERWLQENEVRVKGQWSGMAVNLADVPFDLPKPNGLTIQVIHHKANLHQWLEVVNVGLFGGREIDQNLILNLIEEQDITIFLGTVNGKPAATSMLFLSSGVAGVYLVSTSTEFRGQGIGKMMTLAPLQMAQKAGYKFGVLQATSMGELVYRKLGFQELFKFDLCRIN